ncbi:MAG TPA: GxxExxY protein [Rhabdochlamydiaceae bacterium]|nr:GxxExxY protein [Rhabdochlamydiaceae bacterium]
MNKEITEKIIASAIAVHKHLGPGLLESAYESCLSIEFDAIGIKYERQKQIPIVYRNKQLEFAFRVDFLVEGMVVIELKSCEEFSQLHIAQVLTYLRLLQLQTGLLLNFNVPLLKNGIKRISL